MTADLVSLKRKFVTSEIVKSALDEFSIIPLVSELSEAIIFSPAINDPDTLTKLTFAPVALFLGFSGPQSLMLSGQLRQGSLEKLEK